MDRRTWLTISLCFLIYVGWQKFYLEPRTLPPGEPQNQLTTKNTAQTVSTTATTTDSSAPTSTSTSSHNALAAIPKQTFSLPTATGTAVLGNGADFLENWQIKNYHLTQTTNAASVNLDYVTNEANQVQLAFDDPEFSYLTNVPGNFSPIPGGVLWTYEDAKVKLTREFKSNDTQPYIATKITADFKGKKPGYAFVSLSSRALDKDPEAQDRQFIYWTNNSVERMHVQEKKIELKDITTDVKYIAASNRYFLLSLVSEGDLEARGLIQPTSLSSGRASLRYMLQGNSITIPLRIYFGPKEIDLLRSVEPTLNHVVDFGFFEIFAYPLLKILKWLDQFVGNYGVAIILLTILLKLVTYPLTYKSMKSMKEMAKLQPQLQKIREKYKDDKEALNREMMSVMKTHGYNPVAGCLPMLIQMPVFFALYRVLYGSIELYQAPFAFWIQDLSRPDHFYVTPILLSATMFLQQKLTPNTAADPAQQKMMQFMPLIFGAFMLTLPSGLTLYMLTNTLASVAQQMILNKKLDPNRARNAVAVAR